MIRGKSVLSRYPFALLLVAAALLLLYTGSSQTTQASSFNPTQTVLVSDLNAGGNPDISSFTTIPQTGDSSFFVQSFSFLPDTITLASDAAISDGTVAGDFEFAVRLGLGNSQCVVPFASPPSITFLHATTARTGTNEVPFADGHFDGTGGGTPAGDGVEAGAQGYPRFLIQSVPGGEVVRFFGHTIILGLRVHVHYLAYPAGSLGLPVGLGKPTLTIFNIGDVGGAPSPSVVTDSCSPFNSRVTTKGLPGDNPNTGADESTQGALQTNPAPSQALFALLILSERDADNDGIVNGDDTCVYNANVGSPYVGADAGDAGESTVGGQTDRIDAGCDKSTIFTDGNPNSWSASGANSFCRAGVGDDNFGSFSSFGVDCDRAAAAPPGDGYPNKGDNCPQVANGLGGDGLIDEDPGDGIDNDGDGQIDEDPVDGIDNRQVLPTSQLDSELLLAGAVYEIDGGPKDDGTGDACDIHPNVPDGHFHLPLRINAKCITGGGNNDSDGDGYCDATEAGLGSNPASPASTPEALNFPTVCADSADNDGDGNTDLNDTGCQKPSHDVAVKKVTGEATICSATVPAAHGDYNVLIQNNGPAADETIELGIMLDAQPSSPPPIGTMFPPLPANKSAGQVTSVNKGTITVNGPINIDSDVDLEWLTKVTISGVSAGNSNPVLVKIDYPACAGGPNANATDYLVTVDICHSDDIAPLGLFGQADCGASAAPGDGGQDRNNANDGPITKTVDDNSR